MLILLKKQAKPPKLHSHSLKTPRVTSSASLITHAPSASPWTFLARRACLEPFLKTFWFSFSFYSFSFFHFHFLTFCPYLTNLGLFIVIGVFTDQSRPHFFRRRRWFFAGRYGNLLSPPLRQRRTEALKPLFAFRGQR